MYRRGLVAAKDLQLSSSFLSSKNIESFLTQFSRYHTSKKSTGRWENSRKVTSSTQDADSDKMKEEYVNVLKVIQRFGKHPSTFPEDEKPFAIVRKDFLGKVMHPNELRIERGLCKIVPLSMLFRHWYTKIVAKHYFSSFEDENGVFNEKNVTDGCKKVFEVICQNAYKNTMGNLIKRGVCARPLGEKFTAVSSQMSKKQRNLFNVTEADIYSVAPGVIGPFQSICSYEEADTTYLAYSLLCCALYKKKLLFDAVRNFELADKSDPSLMIPMPSSYGFQAPRLVMAYITLGNKVELDYNKVRKSPNFQSLLDQDVNLIEFNLMVV